MKFHIDTANIREILDCMCTFDIAGVTTNPSMLGKGEFADLFGHLREIRRIIGKDRLLHVQVLAYNSEDIIKEAYGILDTLDDDVRIKIPATEQGLIAMGRLIADGVHVTATGIFNSFQGFFVINKGVEWVAPYCKRMDNMGMDYKKTLRVMRQNIDREESDTRILAASFKNADQVIDALIAGAHTATVSPSILREAMTAEYLDAMLKKFKSDWESYYDGGICEQIDRIYYI